MKIWNGLMQLVLLMELLIAIGGAIFMHAFVTSIKGRIIRPTIPFVILMAAGWLFIPNLPSIDNPSAAATLIIQVVSFSALLVASGLVAFVVLALFGEKPKRSSGAAWPWR